MEDIDEELEEFSRLTYMGNFREAKSFFHENLRTFIDTPYVFVEYAEMLLSQGDYKSIQLLDDSRVFPDINHGKDVNDTHLQALHHNWLLIQATSLCYTQYEQKPIRDKLPHMPLPTGKFNDLGYTEVRFK